VTFQDATAPHEPFPGLAGYAEGDDMLQIYAV
jgi:hypothetical protein